MQVVNLIHFKLITNGMIINHCLWMNDNDTSFDDCEFRSDMNNIYVIWMLGLSMIIFNYLFG